MIYYLQKDAMYNLKLECFETTLAVYSHFRKHTNLIEMNRVEEDARFFFMIRASFKPLINPDVFIYAENSEFSLVEPIDPIYHTIHTPLFLIPKKGLYF